MRYLSVILSILLVVSSSLFVHSKNNTPAFKQGELLLKLYPTENIQQVVQGYSILHGKGTNIRIKKQLVKSLNIWQLSFDTCFEVSEMIQILSKDKRVQIVQANHLISYRSTSPNDPLFNQQWQYINDGSNGGVVDADIDADLAWDFTVGGLTTLGDTIVVCVVDDGIDTNHPDFGNNLWKNYHEIPNNNLDDDDNGYIDDFLGWNTYSNNDDISGGFGGGGHGTSVAGIVGAKGNNNIGVCGVNWNVKLMIVPGGGDEAEAIAAYSYPLVMRSMYNETNGNKGAFVVATNSSWGIDFGQPADSPLWCEMYDEMGAVGILSAGATANSNVNVDVVGDLPSACTSNYLITVTNVTRDDTKEIIAGYGLTSIDLGAFGEETYTVNSTKFGGPYAGFGGTSGATPHVAGTIALLYAAPCESIALLAKTDPAGTALLIKKYILDGVDPNQSLAGITVTGGRLNINNSMMLLMNGDCSSNGCFTPYNLHTTNITDITTNISWSDVDSAQSYLVQYKATTDANWQSAQSNTNNYNFTGLKPCTQYQVQIQANCNGASNSNLSTIYTFTTEGCCVPPSNIALSDITTNSALLTFDKVFAATAYIVEIKESTAPNFTVQNITNPPFNFVGLSECTEYYVKVTTICGGNTPSQSSEIKVFTTKGCGVCVDAAYCSSKGNSDLEWIKLVKLGSINNSTLGDGGYGNFTNFTTNLNKNETYSIQVAPGYLSQSYPERFKVWIDYDQNGQFNNNELIYDTQQGITNTSTGSFIVPATAQTGSTRLRVSMQYQDDFAPNLNSCSAIEYGEVEDYCVSIKLETNVKPITTKIAIFPINFNNQLNIEILNNLENWNTIEMYNILGNLVLSKNIDNTNNNTLTISLITDKLHTGVYFVKLKSKNQQHYLQKVIKIK